MEIKMNIVLLSKIDGNKCEASIVTFAMAKRWEVRSITSTYESEECTCGI